MRRFAAVLLLALVSASSAAAQSMRPPLIRAPWQGDRSTPMRLHALRVDVKIVGHIATTTWDLTVFNPQARVLEGELVFPLGEGQTVSRFAMDVNGALREGVVVEKEKGRQAFEDIVRRGIDPGLLEKTSGNSFRARVYPIPPNGYKRCVIAYEQELRDGGDGTGGSLLYYLPLTFTDKVDTFTLRVEVLDQADAPRVLSSPLSTFAFKAWQRAFVAEDTQRDVVLDKALRFVVPKGNEGRGAFVSADRGQRYFYVTVTPRASRQAKALPKRLLIVWDASYSARLRNVKKELELLDAYVQRLGGATIGRAVFRNDAEAVRWGTWAEARKALEQAPADGATAFGALDLSKEQADEVLLFSDGLGTFGGGDPRFPNCPVTAINSAQAANHDWLRAVAEAKGGEYIDLMTRTVAEGVQALTTVPLTLLRATFDPAQVSDVYPSRAAAVRGPFGLAGRLRADRARITLHFGHGTTEEYSRSFDLDAAVQVAAPLARVWAQKKLAELSVAPVRNADAILALGRQFGIVTDDTSLIVLDRVEDYVRYSIEPPDELRTEYDQLVKAGRDRKLKTEKDHLEQVVAQFRERQEWWRTEFKPGPVKDKPVVAAAEGVAGGVAGGVIGGAVPPPSPATARADAVQGAGGGNRQMLAARMAAAEAPGAPRQEKSGGAPELAGSIDLKPWSPDTPYLKELKALPRDGRYTRYLTVRDTYGTTPGFFLDVADLLRDQGDRLLAERVLTNLAEMKPDDPTLLRVLGYRLRQLGHADAAVWTFQEVFRLRGDEPQSHRDLALALAAAGQTQRAVDLMWGLGSRPWDNRFRDINLIVVGEMNAAIALAKTRPDTSKIDPRLLENLPVDIRVVLNWDTPNSDMDLHVIDPRGEECFYSHQKTALGGRISADVTTGFGPEEFLLKKAMPGEYLVRAKYFGTGEQTAIGATTVVLELYLRYATGQVENKSITLRLEGRGRMVDVGTFTFGPGSK